MVEHRVAEIEMHQHCRFPKIEDWKLGHFSEATVVVVVKFVVLVEK